jgi:hypothetical protein
LVTHDPSVTSQQIGATRTVKEGDNNDAWKKEDEGDEDDERGGGTSWF